MHPTKGPIPLFRSRKRTFELEIVKPVQELSGKGALGDGRILSLTKQSFFLCLLCLCSYLIALYDAVPSPNTPFPLNSCTGFTISSSKVRFLDLKSGMGPLVGCISSILY